MVVVYRYRDWVALLPAAGLVVLLAAGGVRVVKPLKPKYDEPVKLEIIDPALLTPPQPPAPPKPPEPRPEPRPQPKVQPPAPRPQPQSRPEPAQPAAEPRHNEPAPAVPPKPAAAVAQAAPTPTPPAPPPAPKVNVEAEFIGRVRAYLNSVKRYPTGREASLQRPEGTVKVWFVLSRDGAVVDSGIEESSNSMLLDQAARRSIGIGKFPAFPEQFQPGQAQHRFVVDLQFKPAGG